LGVISTSRWKRFCAMQLSNGGKSQSSFPAPQLQSAAWSDILKSWNKIR
jgi:hypothetical protein